MATIGMPSARTDTPATPAAPAPPRISPAERQFLETQGRAIMMRGGTETDVVKYVQHHVGLPRELRRAKTLTTMTERGGEPEAESGLIGGMSLAAVQGATFGFGDEVFGSVYGLLSGASAAEGREEFRDLYEGFRRNHTGLAFLAEAAGGMATGAGVAKAAGLGTGIAMQAAEGVAGGAAAAAGMADNATISERAQAALVGGIAGGVLGGAAAGVFRVAGSVVKPAVRSTLDRVRGFMQARTIADAVKSGVDPAAARTYINLWRSNASSNFARQIISDVAGAEGLDVPTLRRTALSLRQSGVNPTLADVMGDGGLALMSETMTHRTPEKMRLAEFIWERQAAQGQRLSGSLFRKLFGADNFGTQNAYRIQQDLSEKMSQVAAPLYRQAHQEMVPVTPRMRELLQESPIFRAAWEEAKRITNDFDLADRLEGQALLPPTPDLPTGSLREAARRRLIELGASDASIESAMQQFPDEFPTEVPVRALDYLQRGLRMVQDRLMTGGELKGKNAADYIATTRQMNLLLQEVDAASPTFAQARQTWAGFSAAQDAIDLARGSLPRTRGFFKKDPEEIVDEIRRLQETNPGLVDFYRIGAMQEIDDVLRGPMSQNELADVAGRVFGARTFADPTDLNASRIKALFPDAPEVGDEFLRQVMGEGRISRTTRALAGGPRGGNLIQETVEAAEGSVPNIRMTPELTGMGAAQQAMVKQSKKFQTRVSDDLASFFSLGIDSPHELDVFFDSLEDFQRRNRLRESGVLKALGGGLGFGLGGMIGGEVN